MAIVSAETLLPSDEEISTAKKIDVRSLVTNISLGIAKGMAVGMVVDKMFGAVGIGALTAYSTYKSGKFLVDTWKEKSKELNSTIKIGNGEVPASKIKASTGAVLKAVIKDKKVLITSALLIAKAAGVAFAIDLGHYDGIMEKPLFGYIGERMSELFSSSEDLSLGITTSGINDSAKSLFDGIGQVDKTSLMGNVSAKAGLELTEQYTVSEIAAATAAGISQRKKAAEANKKALLSAALIPESVLVAAAELLKSGVEKAGASSNGLPKNAIPSDKGRG